MPRYVVRYIADIEIEADNEEEALGYAVDEWQDNPDGSWEVIGVYEEDE